RVGRLRTKPHAMYACVHALMKDGRGNRCGRDVSPREEREFGHAGACIGKERATTWIANNPDLVQVTPQVREAPRLIPLEQGKGLIESSNDIGRLDVGAAILD